MTNFSFPDRLKPLSILRLFNAGIIDVGALSAYAAIVLILVLIARRARDKSPRNTYILIAVVALLGLVIAVAHWPDNLPPIYIHLNGPAQPSLIEGSVP